MERENQEYISIVNATENNLKHVSLKIPKKKITVKTIEILTDILRDIFSIHSSEQTAFFEFRRYFGIIITHSFSFVNIFLSFFDNFIY